MFVQGEGCLLTFTLYHSHPGIWYMNRFLLTHFLTCTFISMSTSISKGCHGHVCWGKPDTTGYGNGSTDLPGTYYSSDAPLHCPLSNILTPSTLLPSYNVHVLGHTWYLSCVLCNEKSKTRLQHSDGAYELQLLFSISESCLIRFFLITKLNQITFHEDNFS